MQCVFLLALVAALKADTKQQAKVNPVEKVTALLEKLQAEIEADGKAEAESYDKFACFCKEQADNKQYAIEKFNEQIDSLKATIADKKAKKAVLDSDIIDHAKEIKKLNKEQDDAQKTRDDEHTAYVTKSTDLSTAIDRFDMAINSLTGSKDLMSGTKKSLLAQKSVMKEAVALAEAFRMPEESYSMLQGDPHGYAYHSNEIVATFEKLYKDFRQKKVDCDKEEQDTLQAFEMETGARRNMITAEEKAKSEKSEMSAQLDSEINQLTTEQQQTTDAEAADQNFLADLTTQCETKAKDWDQRSTTRSAELQAIAEALELLKGDVAKMYKSSTDLGLLTVKKSVPSKRAAPLVEVQTEEDADDEDDDVDDEPIAFLQLRKESKLRKPNTAAERRKVVGFLSKKAGELKSTVLSTLLLKIRSSPSPFAKVKQMIQDLVARLEEEASSEADQKSWCDDNMAETNSEKAEAQKNIESLNAKMTELKALISQRTEEILTLSQEIADLNKALNEQTELREEDKAENQQTVADATAGKNAVTNALEILNGFYNPSFVQLKQAPAAEGYERFSAANAGSDGKTVGDMAPDAGGVSGEYGGKTDASKSILTLMEQIQEDFANQITATTNDEAAAEGAFQGFKTETDSSASGKTTLKGTKEGEKATAEGDLETAASDHKKESDLLQAALDELEKLKPVCVDSGMSWEERSARRDQEIDALKEALKILQDTDFGF
jgi:uncharacterized coiled-coil DUF342 family protein